MRLYGLSERDSRVIVDTLEFGLPFPTNKRKAQAVPANAERARGSARFCEMS